MKIKTIEIQSRADIIKLKQDLSNPHISLDNKKAMLKDSFGEGNRLSEVALNHRKELYKLWEGLIKL